ncbi:hypothetical protein NB466_20600 [Vibrio fluvialis]|uniref:hypothetical protein n=1 Tax=Vibrio fluvialis TaxID=676 RepID=UPI001C9D22A4|nr:hypothetical protein [Vibrio fluvialis]MBY7813061.1 hypothetical protein [Vibrio fluvialis]MBY8232824.1 hypothetical protein [Vibrio fluvialis]MCR9301254.1 hypothetical protein [Vibrio fluvialis]
MKGPTHRFTLFRDNSHDSELRFYISYLYFKKHGNLLNGYDLSVLQRSGLKHHFTEIVAESLMILTEDLENGILRDEKKREIRYLLNDLNSATQKYMLPHYCTSWINSYRALFFVYLIIKISIKSNILITNTRFSKVYIGQFLWPTLNSRGQQERKEEHEKKIRDMFIRELSQEDRQRNSYSREGDDKQPYLTEENLTDEKVEQYLKDEEKTIEKMRSEGSPYLDALTELENYDPVNDQYARNKIIDYFNVIAFTQEAYRVDNARFLENLQRLYRQSYSELSSYRGIIKNDNHELINKTYERLIKQFELLRFFPPVEDPEIRQDCIVAFLDVLCITTNKDEFQERFKLIRDKFSLDKSECEDFTLDFSNKQWNMLVDIADSKSHSKIKQELNKMIRAKHKLWKAEENIKNKEKASD